MDTAAKIKALRSARGWSQQEAAAELGIDQGTVSRLERGVLEPSGPVSRLLDRLMVEAPAPSPSAEKEQAA